MPTDRVWIELREPGLVPDLKGPFPSGPKVISFLREVFRERPTAYATVITLDYEGRPLLQDGPEYLMVADGRSMRSAARHIDRTEATHSAQHRLAAENEQLRHTLATALQRLFFYNERAAAELAAKAGLAPPERPKPDLHRYEPNSKYPWFCKHCGYPEHETLKHTQERT